ncbi:hypothetical protein ACGFWE_21510 [Streptomyces sp. NPDC048523]
MVEAAAWDGKGHVPVEGASVAWATASGEPSVITFDAGSAWLTPKP